MIKYLENLKQVYLFQTYTRIQNSLLAIFTFNFNRYIYFFSTEVYTIEFQKRGLPHVHIILLLEDDSKVKDSDDIDKIIFAELLDKIADQSYELVGKYMMHGPCGQCDTDAPCMRDGKCSKYFPKKFSEHTIVDEQSYPTY